MVVMLSTRNGRPFTPLLRSILQLTTLALVLLMALQLHVAQKNVQSRVSGHGWQSAVQSTVVLTANGSERAKRRYSFVG